MTLDICSFEFNTSGVVNQKATGPQMGLWLLELDASGVNRDPYYDIVKFQPSIMHHGMKINFASPEGWKSNSPGPIRV